MSSEVVLLELGLLEGPAREERVRYRSGAMGCAGVLVLLLAGWFSSEGGERKEGEEVVLVANGVLGVAGTSGEWFSSLTGVLARVPRGVSDERGVMSRSMERERVTGPVSRSEGRMKPLMAGWWERMGLGRALLAGGGGRGWGELVTCLVMSARIWRSWLGEGAEEEPEGDRLLLAVDSRRAPGAAVSLGVLQPEGASPDGR